jgi:hypothetical protein
MLALTKWQGLKALLLGCWLLFFAWLYLVTSWLTSAVASAVKAAELMVVAVEASELAQASEGLELHPGLVEAGLA